MLQCIQLVRNACPPRRHRTGLYSDLHDYTCLITSSSDLLLPKAECKRSNRFHHPAQTCNVTGIPLGAHQNVAKCGHLVQLNQTTAI